jgi:hypothetical protein
MNWSILGVASRYSRVGFLLRAERSCPPGHTHFRDRIEPMLIDKNIEFIGEVDDHAKQAFLGNATALLFPIDWPEPFRARNDRSNGVRRSTAMRE